MSAHPGAIRDDPDRYLVLAATLAWAALLVAYSLLTPVWRSPDETSHFDLVLDVAAGRGYAAWDGDVFATSVLQASDSVRRLPRLPIEPGGALPALPPIEDTGEQSVTRRNHMTQHPSAYYQLLGAELHAARLVGVAPSTVSGQLAVTRVLSSFLLVPLPVLAWMLARLLAEETGIRRLALVLPLVVPGLAQVGSGVTNDSLSILLLSLLSVVLAAWWTDRDSARLTVAVGVLCGLALFTKAFGAAALGWTGVVLLAGVKRRGLQRMLVASAGVAALAFAAGGWWYARNLIRYGRILPSLEETRFASDAVLASSGGLGRWSDRFWPFVGRGVFGLFGAAEVSLEDRLYRGALVLAILGVILGSVVVWRRRGPVVLLIAPLLMLVILQVSQSYRLYTGSGIVALGHGRYLLPAFVPCAVLIAHAFGRGGVGRRAAPIAVLIGIVLHTNLWLRLLAFFWSADGSFRALRVAIDWSPLPRLGSVVALVALAPLTATLMLLLLRPSRTSR